ncbi:hypothetical protein V6N13_015507 [Hibiscus sabdariffa]
MEDFLDRVELSTGKVLSNPQKRAIYDRYGEEGLKGQAVPPPSAGGLNPRSADDIFARFFGSSSPFGEMGGGSTSRAFDFGSIFGDDTSSSSGGSRPMNKAPPIEKTLLCSLEDLYKGIPKKVKVSREIADANGKTQQVEEILTINIKPGWKKGTKITFPEKGNVQPYVIPADIVFIIDEKPHEMFTRDSDDLIVSQKISLSEALTGYTVRVTTLDGRNLTVPITDVINPSYEKVVPMEEQKSGMKKLLALGTMRLDSDH